jgi:hypothetical protein
VENFAHAIDGDQLVISAQIAQKHHFGMTFAF